MKSVDELIVNCRREQVGPLARALDGCAVSSRFAIETSHGRGPVAGLLEGLRSASAVEAVVTACDMPPLDPTFLDSLFADASGATGAVPIFDGRSQPLCAVYRVAPTIEACRSTLMADDRSLGGVLERLDPISIPEDRVRERTRAATFRNINTRADLAAAEAQLALST